MGVCVSTEGVLDPRHGVPVHHTGPDMGDLTAEEEELAMNLSRIESVAKLTNEPSQMMVNIKRSFFVTRAKLQHGINDDVDQYLDDIKESVPEMRERDRRRVRDWLDTVSKALRNRPAEEIPAKLPPRTAAAAVVSPPPAAGVAVTGATSVTPMQPIASPNVVASPPVVSQAQPQQQQQQPVQDRSKLLVADSLTPSRSANGSGTLQRALSGTTMNSSSMAGSPHAPPNIHNGGGGSGVHNRSFVSNGAVHDDSSLQHLQAPDGAFHPTNTTQLPGAVAAGGSSPQQQQPHQQQQQQQQQQLAAPGGARPNGSPNSVTSPIYGGGTTPQNHPAGAQQRHSHHLSANGISADNGSSVLSAGMSPGNFSTRALADGGHNGGNGGVIVALQQDRVVDINAGELVPAV
jgi:hypothetical protein